MQNALAAGTLDYKVKQLLCYWGCVKLRHQAFPEHRVVIPLIETQALGVSLANSATLDVHLSRLVTGLQVCSMWAKDKHFVPHCFSLLDTISYGSKNWAELPKEEMMAITQWCLGVCSQLDCFPAP